MIEPKALAAGTADTIAIIALVVVVGIVFIALQAGGSTQVRMKDRLSRLQKRQSKKTSLISETAVTLKRHIAEEPGGLIGLLLKPLPNAQRIQDKMERAGVPNPNARIFMLRSLIVFLICVFSAIALSKPVLIGVAAGVVIGVWIPLKWLDMKIEKNMRKFLQIFPDAIDLIVRGLRSGLPISDSFVVVASEVPNPVGEVFQHMVDKMKLGVPMEKALQDMSRQLNNTEFNFFCTSIILQRETGGNLGEILGNLSDVLRKRYMMKMKIKAMTSEARASAWIVGSLPFLVSCAVLVMSPDYLKPLWTTESGMRSLMYAGGMLWFGCWIMKRMAKFEI